MLKGIISIIFLCTFFSCSERKKSSDGNLQIPQNDTFDFFNDEYNIPILSGFSVDTIKHYEKETQYSQTIIYPTITERAFKETNGILKAAILSKAANSNPIDSTDKTPIDTSKEVFGFTEENILLKMYKNKSLISYGFLCESTEPGRMRPFRKYFTINYDTLNKKFIAFSDYFNISNHDDSALVKSIIYSEVAYSDFEWISLSNDINFSFDKENIYFYFDMFGETGTPTGTVKRVKKKYLANFINNDYK